MIRNVERTDTTIKLLSVALATTLLAGAAAPAMATVLTETTRSTVDAQAKFAPRLEPVPTVPTIQVAKAIVPVQSAEEVAEMPQPAPTPAAKTAAPLPQPVAPPAQATRTAVRRPAAAATGSNSAPVAAANNAQPSAPAPASSGGIAEARAILARYVSTYPILQGTTVEFGDSRGNPQAIVYYKSARIIINPNHTVSLERIIAHEIWHIIDWRDNGQINWGENVPPANANDFRR